MKSWQMTSGCHDWQKYCHLEGQVQGKLNPTDLDMSYYNENPGVPYIPSLYQGRVGACVYVRGLELSNLIPKSKNRSN